MKNALIKGALSLHKLLHRKIPSSASSYLIFSTTGVGDTLWGTPAIRAIKKFHPESHLCVLTSPLGKKLLQHNPYINEILTINDPHLRKNLQSLHAHTAFIFHISQRIMMPYSHFSDANHIIGTAGINKGLDDLLTICLDKRYEHEIARRLRLVQAAGIPPDGPEMEIFLTQEEQRNVPQFSGPILGIHPGAKDRFKQYPPHLFAQAAKNFKGTVIITGGQDEVELCKQVAQKIPGSISLAGQLTLRQLAAFIGSCQLFMTNDTGPMHMAFAMKTKTIALFGPTDPHLCGPYQYSNAEVVQVQPTCTPCLKKKCREAFCMRQISPTMLKDLLNNSTFS